MGEERRAVRPDVEAKTRAPGGEMPPDAWVHLAYCPNCGTRLEKRQCKARCHRCGYFQDCSDTIV